MSLKYVWPCRLQGGRTGEVPGCAAHCPYALTPNTVALIPTLGALFPKGGPVQDPGLTSDGTCKWGTGADLLALDGDVVHPPEDVAYDDPSACHPCFR